MVLVEDDLYVIEEAGINISNESSLHDSIKRWYVKQGDRVEAKVNGYIIDIKRDGLLIEIQTKNFYAISKKIRKLLESFQVKLVYPVSRTKYISKIHAETRQVINRRKSPKSRTDLHIFQELLRAPDLINHPNFSIQILFIEEEEVRCDDGKGSWRRKGISIVDRRLIEVLESKDFCCKEDFLDLLSDSLIESFTNKELSEVMKVSTSVAQKITYTLKKMGAIIEVGKKGNALVYSRSIK